MQTLILSCEHATNFVPRAYSHLFREAGDVLASHRGWDPGALPLAHQISEALGSPLYEGQVSRLLVELNRSLDNPQLWSEFTASLSSFQRENILEQYYHPHRASVINATGRAMEKGHTAIHIGVHSFTPVWEGEVREVDLGLLYDPDRPAETAFCQRWGERLTSELPWLRVRHNEPYRGTDDGLTTSLRELWHDLPYLGIEIEVSQHYPQADPGRWIRLKEAIVDSLGDVLRSEQNGQAELFN